MAPESQVDTVLPATVREGLESFCAGLQDALGDQLVSIVLYGGLAKGEYVPGSSDVNVMLVFREATVEVLDRAAPPVRRGMLEFALSVLVLTEEGLGRSTDVFPIKFLDMQNHHRVLWGKDVLAGLTIARDHLRLRCEQEIKNLLLKLRRFYLQRGSHTDLIEGTLKRAISSFLGDLNALLVLKTAEAPSGKEQIVDAAVRELGLAEKTLRDVLALKSGSYRPGAAELKRLYGAFMATVQEAANIADRH